LSIIVQICANNQHFLLNMLSTDARCLVIIGPTWCAVQYRRFLLRDAMLSAVHAVVVYLSVRLSMCVCVCLSHYGIV